MDEIRRLVVQPHHLEISIYPEKINLKPLSQTHRQPFPFLACTLSTCNTVVGRVGSSWWHGWSKWHHLGTTGWSARLGTFFVILINACRSLFKAALATRSHLNPSASLRNTSRGSGLGWSSGDRNNAWFGCCARASDCGRRFGCIVTWGARGNRVDRSLLYGILPRGFLRRARRANSQGIGTAAVSLLDDIRFQGQWTDNTVKLQEETTSIA